VLKIVDLKRTYISGKSVIKAVDNISIEFRKSEFVCILGPSGCGKTTLLNILGTLDKPNSGEVLLHGNSLSDFSDDDLDMYRNKALGFIFQTHNLIGHLNVLDNVQMAMKLGGVKRRHRRKKAKALLSQVGLVDHLRKKPNELSVGQRQRVAIARALSNNPDIILADEPTGSVDSKTSEQIMTLIKDIAKDKLVIMVTHDETIAEKYATRIIRLDDGKVISDSDPYDTSNSRQRKRDLKLKKTSMPFITSFTSALKNLKTKKGRSFLTALASSVGIIGISLTLALATGTNKAVDRFQSNVIAHYPINISSNFLSLDNPNGSTTPDINLDPGTTTIEKRQNNITSEYVDYIKAYQQEKPDNISGITIKPLMRYSLVSAKPDSEGVIKYSSFYRETGGITSPSLQKTRTATLLPDGEIFDLVYDVLAGTKPETAHDPLNKTFGIVVSVDKFNYISSTARKELGLEFNDSDEISFDSIIGKTIYFNPGAYNSKTFNPDNAIKLVVTGVIRVKDNGIFTLFNRGFGYTSELVDYVKENYPDTVSNVDFIDIYPNGLKAKDDLKAYLNAYNDQFSSENHPLSIDFTDDSAAFSEISKDVINVISLGLLAFSAVSLLVSSMMIAIITYTSVVERTNEIGIMRALGARKKDVRLTFNSENIIIGIFAAALGVSISHALTYPLNIIVEHYAQIKNIAHVTLPHTILLLIISVTLAFIAGLVPSKVAANKKPVEALNFR